MTDYRSYEGQLCVESDGSKKLEADIPASCTDSLFSKPPQSGMAEMETVWKSAYAATCALLVMKVRYTKR